MPLQLRMLNWRRTILAVERTIFQVKRRERHPPAITIKLGKIYVLRLIGIRNPEQL